MTEVPYHAYNAH